MKFTPSIHSGVNSLRVDLHRLSGLKMNSTSEFTRSLDLTTLLHKLSELGLSDHLVSWFSSYLSNRTQSVFIDSSYSPPSPMISGVPQGSCLGPLLFILFINDISFTFPKSIKYSVYADDLKLFAEAPIHSDDLQSALNVVSSWSFMWNLGLSETKCTVMHYGNHNPRRQYHINNIPLIPPSDKKLFVKDLGVFFTPSLSFSEHINKFISKSRSKVNLLFKSFRSTSPTIYAKSFTTFILPHLEYGSIIWNPVHSVELTKSVEKVQRDFTRRLYIRCNLPHVPYRQRLIDLNMMTLENRRTMIDLSFVHSILHKRTLLDTSSLLYLSPLSRPLRNSHNLRITLPFLPPSSHSTVASRTITLWNSLPASSVSSRSDSFRLFVSSQPPSFFPNSKIKSWLDL